MEINIKPDGLEHESMNFEVNYDTYKVAITENDRFALYDVSPFLM